MYKDLNVIHDKDVDNVRINLFAHHISTVFSQISPKSILKTCLMQHINGINAPSLMILMPSFPVSSASKIRLKKSWEKKKSSFTFH